jgi:hypothetical protein
MMFYGFSTVIASYSSKSIHSSIQFGSNHDLSGLSPAGEDLEIDLASEATGSAAGEDKTMMASALFIPWI